MEVKLDAELCIGSGSCEDFAPQVFRMGDEGVIIVIDANPPAELADAVQDAVVSCPTAAISISD